MVLSYRLFQHFIQCRRQKKLKIKQRIPYHVIIQVLISLDSSSSFPQSLPVFAVLRPELCFFVFFTGKRKDLERMELLHFDQNQKAKYTS